MQADERQAAAAYAYAWWMTGDDDAASGALEAALATPEPTDSAPSAHLAALMGGVRRHLGDQRTMPPASELALLHDGFGVPLADAAPLAGVAPPDAALALATGRLDALLETVREDFRHTERLGGLAVGDPADLEHAEQCRSCTRAVTLIERGRVELREVSPVSGPVGMIARLVGAAAPAGSGTPPAQPDQTPTPSVAELEEMLRHGAPLEPDTAGAAAPPIDAPPAEAPPVEAPPGPGRVPTTPARRRAIPVLALGGLVTMGALVWVLLGTDEPPDTPIAGRTSEQPVVTRTDPTTAPTQRPDPTPTDDPFGPPPPDRKGFAVVAAGLLLDDTDDLAPSGATIGPQDPLRVAVDYANGSKGAEINAVWRVEDKVFERLRTVVSARDSRHVWGVMVPPGGWPVGRHRISVTTNEGLAGIIDFTIRSSD